MQNKVPARIAQKLNRKNKVLIKNKHRARERERDIFYLYIHQLCVTNNEIAQQKNKILFIVFIFFFIPLMCPYSLVHSKRKKMFNLLYGLLVCCFFIVVVVSNHQSGHNFIKGYCIDPKKMHRKTTLELFLKLQVRRFILLTLCKATKECVG